MSIHIRRAHLGDLSWLISQLAEFDQWAASKYHLRPSVPEMYERLGEWITQEDVYPFWIATQGEVLIGFIVGVRHNHLYNPQIICLSELFWWVTPKARGSRAGYLLLDQFVAHGREHAMIVTMVLEHKSPVNPRILERFGFAARETSYVLEV